MICDFHNRVVKRKKDGTRLEIIRCADSAGPYFTQEVTDEQCSQCPRHLAAVELARAMRLLGARLRKRPDQAPKTPSLVRRSMNYAEALRVGWRRAAQNDPMRKPSESSMSIAASALGTIPTGRFVVDVAARLRMLGTPSSTRSRWRLSIVQGTSGKGREYGAFHSGWWRTAGREASV